MKTFDSSRCQLLSAPEDSGGKTSYAILTGTETRGELLGLFKMNPGSFDEQTTVLQVFCVEGTEAGLLLPDRCDDIANEILENDLDWQLQLFDEKPFVPQTIEIEVGAGDSAAELASKIQRSRNIDGCLLYISKAESDQRRIEIDGNWYPIGKVSPQPDDGTFIKIRRGMTTIELSEPLNHQVVDVVILADVSGSMGIKDLSKNVDIQPTLGPSRDLSEGGWAARFFGFISKMSRAQGDPRYISRMESVRSALTQFIEFRSRSSLTKSRIALMQFSNWASLKFPETGFIELDRSTPAPTLEAFRTSIGNLDSTNQGTDIGNAIQQAATYFNKHSPPHHRKLLVLLSDGADWTQKKEDSRGEVLETISQEPVQLARYLHSTTRLEIQPIGISTPDLYRAYVQRTRDTFHAGCVPNHDLLNALIEVSGGRTALTGDASILEEYFRDLSQGIRSVVGSFPSSPMAIPDRGTIDRLIGRSKVVKTKTQVSSESVDLLVLYDNFESALVSFRYCVQSYVGPKIQVNRDNFGERYNKKESIIKAPASRLGIGQVAQALYFLIHETLDNQLIQSKPSKNAFVQAVSEKLLASECRRHLAALRHKIHAHGHISRGNESESESLNVEADAHAYFVGLRFIDRDDDKRWAAYRSTLIQRVTQELKAEVEHIQALEVAKPFEEEAAGFKELVIDW